MSVSISKIGNRYINLNAIAHAEFTPKQNSVPETEGQPGGYMLGGRNPSGTESAKMKIQFVDGRTLEFTGHDAESFDNMLSTLAFRGITV